MDAMEVDGGDEAKVQVRFTSKLVSVPDNVFAVPDRLTRAGLAEVVHGLLLEQHSDDDDDDDDSGAGGDSSAVRFDFLISGELLRSSLATFLSNRHVRTSRLLPSTLSHARVCRRTLCHLRDAESMADLSLGLSKIAPPAPLED